MNLEQINLGGIGMVILDIMLDNFYSFKDFHMNLTYPKKIVGSSINNEHLSERPNFRYKKVNIIMGANASGKTTLGRTLMKIFNFIDKKNYEIITEIIADNSKEASFTLDMATTEKIFYRISCTVTPKENGIYNPEDIKLVVQSNKINLKDSYESCVERIKMKEICSEDNYLVELEKISGLDWLFEYPEDTDRILRLPKKDSKFKLVLENILKALDPSIQKIEKLRGVENAYVIRLQNSDVILKDGDRFNTNVLSSGTKAGVEIARVVSALLHERNTFYYCDEKFPYIHSDIEKSIISLMISLAKDDSQLFFTTHNTDILDMNLPKHSFTFLKKDKYNTETPISCVNASAYLKRNTDSLKCAVENDLFCTAPSTNLIYDIAEL